MNAREKLEITCSKAWPPLVEDPLGEWRLRWAAGFTGRANSALAVGDPGRPLAEALRAVCDFAHDRGITPMVQVVRDSPNEGAIAAAGWVPATGHGAGHEVEVLTAPSVPAPAVRGVTVGDEPAPGWWELTLRPDEDSPAARQVLTGGKVGYGVAVAGGSVAGAVRAALVDDWLHVGRLAVSPAFRRRGLASALMGAVQTWGAEHGAHRTVLQVAEGNSGALALYAGLGYAPHHRYRYWVPAPGSCEDSTS
ncbi:GCN5-related N-acetyltransferase [Amycolatopsis mediterranei S699]|uniref:GCN5-related N-acetyltransferase n=3 Tax=Amycolatopsis mediterranei TaxID=33910 RepID=A0A0H3CW33_AMYMU|nr:GNAT family N-acetyltransferase [Amycolatopsis mediterranei]ADJ42842.1 GCN5-related N-acetyltransferase [Amycolatopsis mediterranei U32]AEK39534.1 GCN5-related N-acetyltransferase [Amycolatopsis mediterranei S699]AFO74556.1 GCN5-related N-acetyltransferase [Amycolatopsis mediterranei S699]AGT81685.1 GCN5-related N-acetyltransferase [Amycolatopsis mediterranei RB]KDO10153.1 GCN5 family acetyltransferase [Amycolatopsis mediterranei]